jgi:chromosome segregation ATPase
MAAQVTEEGNRGSRSSAEEVDGTPEPGPVKSVRFRVNGAVTGPEKATKEVTDCGWKVLLDAAFFGNKDDSMKRYQSAVQQITTLQEEYETAASERDAMIKNTRLTGQKIRALESDNATLKNLLFRTQEEKEDCIMEHSMERSATEEGVAKVMSDLEAMKKEVENLKQERDMAIEKETSSQKELEQAHKEIREMGEQLETALSDRDRILDENLIALSKCGELSQTAATSKKERDIVADEKRMLEVRLRSLQEEYDRVTDLRETTTSRVRREKEETCRKLEELQNEYSVLKDQYEWSLKECNKALSKSETLRKEVRSMTGARDNMAAERDRAREDVEKFKAQQVIMRAEIQNLTSELEGTHRKLNLLRSVMESPKLTASNESLMYDGGAEKQLKGSNIQLHQCDPDQMTGRLSTPTKDYLESEMMSRVSRSVSPCRKVPDGTMV